MIEIRSSKSAGEWFGAPDRIRLSYALDIKLIEEGLGRIEDAMKKVRVL